MEYLKTAIDSMFDALETVYSEFTISGGKQTQYVLYVCVGILAMSVTLRLLELPCFITWQVALTATLFMGLVYSIKFVTTSQVDNFVGKFKDIKETVVQKVKKLNELQEGEEDNEQV